MELSFLRDLSPHANTGGTPVGRATNAGAQRVGHHEIAAYGTVKACARQLGFGIPGERRGDQNGELVKHPRKE